MKIFKYILLSIIILDLILLGVLGFIYLKATNPYEPQAKDEYISINIETGMSANQIAAELASRGVIENIFYFMMFADLEGKSSQLKAGEYEFSPSMSIEDIIDVLVEGQKRNIRRVTIPEGYNKEQIIETLYERGVISSKISFLSLVNLTADNVGNLLELPYLSEMHNDAGSINSLEGFLFPDTYEFFANSEDQDVLRKFLENFEVKTQESRSISDNFYETLIFASILEKEVQTEQDMRIVAGILNNRLEIGMPLQVDATLAYLTGKKTGQITNQDKLIDSPYNTYQNRGLPPAPIANPGLKAINASLNPIENNYLYYLNSPDGTTHFSETLEGHNENKARYLK